MNGSVAIVGAGVIGTVAAIELHRLGYEVTLIDREEPGSRGAASFGNGGWLCPASIIPVSVPSLLWRLPSFLFGKSAPLSGNPGFAVRNASHFARFVTSGLTHKRVRHKAGALSTLLSDSVARHQALAREAGLAQLIRKDGLLYTYGTERAFRRDLRWWNLRRDLGVSWTFLDGKTLRAEEPGIERDCFGAVLVIDGGHCIDPAAYVRGLAEYAQRCGVHFLKAEVAQLIHADQRLVGLETSNGTFAFDAAVICGGAHSRPLTQGIGDYPPLLSERGYHVGLPPGQELRRPVMFDDALMVATPMAGGIRLAGQVEIAAPETAPDWSRAQSLLDLARGYLGALPADIHQPGVSVWMGCRPAVADELPVIGRSTNMKNVHFAFGHGFTGLGAAPATAALVGHSLQSGRATNPQNSPFFPSTLSRAHKPRPLRRNAMSDSPVSIHKLDQLNETERKNLLQRTENDLSSFMEKVIPIIEAVRRDGDAALADFANKFDTSPINADQIRATPEEFAAARASVDQELIETLKFAAGNIRHFHEKQMPETLALHETHPGVLVGDRWNAIDSVACYVPRGKGSFPSSVLMTAIPAKVAGVKKVIVITPPGPDGTVDPATLVAAEIAGVSDVFKCGGAQGIAAVAYGTQTVPKCDKVVGPGSPWVVAAKKQLSSVIDPGSPAGPSELIIFSDGTVPPELVALDLCVESEHGPDSSVFFVTDNEEFARAVASHVPSYWSQMGDVRAQYSKTVLTGQRGGIVVAGTREDAFAFVNDYAPEHLAVLADNAWQYLTRFEHAGEILLGPHSAISVANFVLGPSHVLPTGAAAKTTSPLAVFDFLKRTSIASLTENAYQGFAAHAERLARYEGFDGHANAVSAIRNEALRTPASAI